MIFKFSELFILIQSKIRACEAMQLRDYSNIYYIFLCYIHIFI